MEPAKIDWEKLESVFVEDHVYENINAPQWVDLLDTFSPSKVPDDVAWFCRPDCNHPRTAEDFLNSTPPSSSSKLLRSVSVSKLIGLVDWTRREPILKKRGGAGHSSSSNEDIENQNPNFSTPTRQMHYFNKATIKSSAQKSSDEAPKPALKATQSAKDLFGGSKDLFGKITDFCNELKKMASSAREDEEQKHEEEEAAVNVLGVRVENKSERPKERHPLMEVGKEKVESAERGNAKETPRKPPLIEAGKERVESAERSIAKETPRKNKIKRANDDDDDAENIPISLNLNNINRKEEEKILGIRTNPPTPQGFSAIRDPVKTTPSKGPKSRLMEREILGELGQSKTTMKEDAGEKSHDKNASIIGGKEGRTLDVFWFFKPCTLSS